MQAIEGSALTASVWTAAVEPVPYRASMAAAGRGWALAISGCGDGSAQLLAAERLAPIVDSAVRDARGSAEQRLQQILAGIDSGLRALGPNSGPGADGVAATWDDGQLWLGRCGLATALVARGGGLAEVLEPESLASLAARHGHASMPGGADIAQRRFGAGPQQPWAQIAAPISELQAAVLATAETWSGPAARPPIPASSLAARAAWLRQALAVAQPARRLAEQAQERVASRGGQGALERFQARAAIVVLKPVATAATRRER